MVRASSSAWVGCSWVPSPALMMGVGRWRARKCGAPLAEWRITMASGRIAPRVFSVSTSDSPLLTLDPDAVMDTASAPRRLAAISKLVRVRVEASKNRLTIILPRSVSSFFKLWLCIGWKSLARARMAAISARSNSSIPSNPAGMAGLSGLFHHEDLLHAVDLLELDLDDLDIAGLHFAPD